MKRVSNSVKKCIFSADQFKSYEHIFGKRGVGPDLAMIKAIHNIKLPQFTIEIKSFLGTTQCISCFLPHYATMVEPQRFLTKEHIQ